MIIPKIIHEKISYDGFLKIKEAQLEFPNKLIKINSKLTKSDAVAILIWNSDNQSFVFTKQYRYPVADKEDDGVFEIVAGTMEEKEEPEATAKREILEEVGYNCSDLELISSFYSSPGYSSEKIHLFLSIVKNSDKIKGEGGGLNDHGEFIETIELEVSEAYDMVKNGIINDAKSIIGLQYFKEQHYTSITNILSEEKEDLNKKISDLQTTILLLNSKPLL